MEMKEKIMIEIESPDNNQTTINTEINYKNKFYALIVKSDDIQNLEFTYIAMNIFLSEVFPSFNERKHSEVKFE
jgi:hypothetical protein